MSKSLVNISLRVKIIFLRIICLLLDTRERNKPSYAYPQEYMRRSTEVTCKYNGWLLANVHSRPYFNET